MWRGLLLCVLASPALAAKVDLDAPDLRFAPPKGRLEVALTFDACDGQVDHRILDRLVADHVRATIFVTGKWLRRNPDAMAVLLAHPDLFEIEDHGAAHLAAIDGPYRLFGLRPAGSTQGVIDEVNGGADALVAAGVPQPGWYRGAGAEYTAGAEATIAALGYRIAGYSLNGDQGASLPAKAVRRRYDSVTPGMVVISHINQPGRPSGEGVAEGIADLEAKGAIFLRLKDAFPAGDAPL